MLLRNAMFRELGHIIHGEMLRCAACTLSRAFGRRDTSGNVRGRESILTASTALWSAASNVWRVPGQPCSRRKLLPRPGSLIQQYFSSSISTFMYGTFICEQYVTGFSMTRRFAGHSEKSHRRPQNYTVVEGVFYVVRINTTRFGSTAREPVLLRALSVFAPLPTSFRTSEEGDALQTHFTADTSASLVKDVDRAGFMQQKKPAAHSTPDRLSARNSSK